MKRLAKKIILIGLVLMKLCYPCAVLAEEVVNPIENTEQQKMSAEDKVLNDAMSAFKVAEAYNNQRQQSEDQVQMAKEIALKSEEKEKKLEVATQTFAGIKKSEAIKVETEEKNIVKEGEESEQKLLTAIFSSDNKIEKSTSPLSEIEKKYQDSFQVVEVNPETADEQYVPVPSNDPYDGNPAVLPEAGSVTEKDGIFISENPTNYPDFPSWYADINQSPGSHNITGIMGRSKDYDQVRIDQGRSDYEHWGLDISPGVEYNKAYAVAPFDCVITRVKGDVYNTFIFSPEEGSKYANFVTEVWYVHTSGLLEGLQEGSHVKAGEPLAYIDGCGNSPVHLHVNVKDISGRNIDPLLFYDVKGRAPYDYISDRLSITTNRYWDFKENKYWWI